MSASDDISPPSDPREKPSVSQAKKATATQFFLRGLAISLPPILTLVILVWIGQLLYGYVVSPVTTVVRFVIAEAIDKSRRTSDFVTPTGLPPLEYCGTNYRVPPEALPKLRDASRGVKESANPRGARPVNAFPPPSEIAAVAYVPFGDWSIPYGDFEDVASHMRPIDWPAGVTGWYMELVTIRYFKSVGSLSALATALTIIALYFIGRLVTARMGQWVVNRFETLVLARVPVISSVYSSVKQVTDFFFSERPLAYNRVVACEFPRRGIWTIGFAMGESLMEMTLAAGEPMISIMVPAAPMPMTGWIVSVPKSSVIDLNLTLDQAFQYFLSCGVLVPENQRSTPELLHRELAKRLASSFAAGVPSPWPAGGRAPSLSPEDLAVPPRPPISGDGERISEDIKRRPS